MARPIILIGNEIEFGPYRVDPAERALTRDGQPIHLAPKTFDLLLVLASSPGHLICKAELRSRVWPDTFVDDMNLAQHVSLLRRVLRDGENGSVFIETVPRLGYRFVGRVSEVQAATAGDSYKEEAVAPETDGEPAPISSQYRKLSFFGSRFRISVATSAIAVGLVGVAFVSKLVQPVEFRHSAEAKAEQNYREGRFFWQKRTEEGYRAAIAHFEEAVRLKPDYADAYAGLADAYILLGSFGVEPLDQVIPKARAAAVRAVEIDEHSAEAHAALGYIMSRFEWNWDEADREFRRAIELSPRDTTAHHWYALHLVTMGKAAEAVSEMKMAQALDPRSSIMSTDTALVLFYARRYDEAIAESSKVIQADPSFGLAHRTLGLIYVAKGQYRQALAELGSAAKLLNEDPWTLAEAGRCYALLGEREKAQAKFEELQELARRRFVSPAAFALLSAALDDKRDESFAWLEREYESHSNVALLAVYPGFDSIRSDPRFQRILDRIGLPQR